MLLLMVGKYRVVAVVVVVVVAASLLDLAAVAWLGWASDSGLSGSLSMLQLLLLSAAVALREGPPEMVMTAMAAAAAAVGNGGDAGADGEIKICIISEGNVGCSGEREHGKNSVTCVRTGPASLCLRVE